MKDSPHKSDNIRPRQTPPIDLSVQDSDDDFFDFPPYAPHTPPAAPNPGRSKSGGRSTSRPGIRLLSLGIACLITAAVVLVAHAAPTPDPRPEDPPASDSDETPLPPDEPQQPTPPEESEGNTPTQQPTEPYHYACDVSDYLLAMEYAPAKEDILLLNKTHAKSASYAPAALVEMSRSDTLYGKEVLLEPTTAAALTAMLLCMRADGITDTYATSGYRSYTYQSQLFALYVNQEMSKNPSLTRDQATALVEVYSARPGYSEHQSGLCVDLMTTTMGNLDVSFENTAAFAWLQENAAQFGFILRYPKEKEAITGYIYEPWHYRFVGKAAALEIAAAGITLEEYLGQTP